jgi:hypothetical protein
LEWSIAHLLITLLLPLGDQISIGIPVLQQPVVELFADGFFLVVQVVDVSGSYRVGNNQLGRNLGACDSCEAVKIGNDSLTFERSNFWTWA